MKTDFFKDIDKISKVVKTVPAKMGAEAVAFSKERFVKSNWMGKASEPWESRKSDRGREKTSSHAILVGKGTAHLKKSIRVLHTSSDLVIIGSDRPYAEIHNEGFKGTQKVKAHKRTRYSRKTREGRMSRKGDIEVKAFTRSMNMPKRQFLGDSPVLGRRLVVMALKEIRKVV